MIGVNDFTNLVRRCTSLKKQGAEISGSMGEMIKNACENKNLDRVAFGIFRKLHAMPSEKLATTLACLDYYRDLGKLDETASEQGELEIARQEAGEEEPKPPKQESRQAAAERDVRPRHLRAVEGSAQEERMADVG